MYDLNYNVGAGGQLSWNLDLVVGPPKTMAANSIGQTSGLRRGEPAEIWLAIDAKSVMTEHGKARRNRQRDLNALHDIIHRRDPRTIVGGLIVVNIAPRFRSPLRTGDPTIHRNIDRLVAETIQMYADLPSRTAPNEQGLDAMGVIVLSHSNIPGESTSLVQDARAPPRGSPVHYISFLERLCQSFGSRYA